MATFEFINEVPLETSTPHGDVPLESILCTEELRRRPRRSPDYKKENRALVVLSTALAGSKPNIIQKLADTILEATDCDSAGLSLLTKEDGGKRFYWPAIAGIWEPHIGGGTPRNFGPCGDVLDRDCTQLVRHFELRYPYLRPAMPPAEECRLVPFYVGGKAVGTIWAIRHTDRRKIDAEDERLMSELGQFAFLAYETLDTIDNLKFQLAAREKAETALRELAAGLEAEVQRLVEANVIGIVISFVLFDEVEKASGALWNLLLGILDKATLTLGDNRKVDFSAAMAFLTSSLGAAEMSSLVSPRLGFHAPLLDDTGCSWKLRTRISRTAIEAARRKFTPEFINRLYKIVVFKSLGNEEPRRIVDIELEMVQQRIQTAAASKPFVVNVTDTAREFLLVEGTDFRYGAWHLKRAIERLLVQPLSNLMASGQIYRGDCIRVSHEDGSLALLFGGEREPVQAWGIASRAA
jgi:hypothetical protein